MIKRISFAIRETLLWLLLLALGISLVILLWGYFGESVLLVVMYVIAWLIYGY